jgi:hypothetical protein
MESEIIRSEQKDGPRWLDDPLNEIFHRKIPDSPAKKELFFRRKVQDYCRADLA